MGKIVKTKRRMVKFSKPKFKYGFTSKCKVCGHEWIPRSKSPLRCPRCGSLM